MIVWKRKYRDNSSSVMVSNMIPHYKVEDGSFAHHVRLHHRDVGYVENTTKRFIAGYEADFATIIPSERVMQLINDSEIINCFTIATYGCNTKQRTQVSMIPGKIRRLGDNVSHYYALAFETANEAIYFKMMYSSLDRATL